MPQNKATVFVPEQVHVKRKHQLLDVHNNAIVPGMLEGSWMSLGARLDFEPATQETGRKSHQAVEWTLTKVTRCEPDEDVNRTYGKKKILLLVQGAFFFPSRMKGSGEGREASVWKPKARNNCGHQFTSGSVTLF